MNILSQAEQFLLAEGRELDRARFQFHFAALSQDDLLAALGRYQNPDGGFHGLEVDIGAPVSNPFATEIALLYCAQASVPAGHPLLQRTAAHLEHTQTEDGDWRFSPAVYEHPLAPWFQGWTWPNLNPAVTIGSLLHRLNLGAESLHQHVRALFTRLHRPGDVANGEFYDVRPYAYMMLADYDLPGREFYASGVMWWLLRQLELDSLPGAGHFFEYVRTPDTYTGRNLPPDILNAQLDRLQAEQAEDGGWPSPYSAAWRPHTTMQNLLVLRAFGRI